MFNLFGLWLTGATFYFIASMFMPNVEYNHTILKKSLVWPYAIYEEIYKK